MHNDDGVVRYCGLCQEEGASLLGHLKVKRLRNSHGFLYGSQLGKNRGIGGTGIDIATTLRVYVPIATSDQTFDCWPLLSCNLAI
jgi:hypothetical protein